MNIVLLKDKAKKSLNGNWGKAFLVSLIFSLVIGACGGVSQGFALTVDRANNGLLFSLFSPIFAIIAEAILIGGFLTFFMNVARGKTCKINDLFSKANLFGTIIVLLILVGVFTTLWSLLLIIPGIIAAFAYSQAQFILLDNPEMSAMDAISKSKEIMKGHKFDYFILNLSFIGWAFLSCFTFGIGFFFLVPYMMVTSINFYDSIK